MLKPEPVKPRRPPARRIADLAVGLRFLSLQTDLGIEFDVFVTPPGDRPSPRLTVEILNGNDTRSDRKNFLTRIGWAADDHPDRETYHYAVED